VITESSILEKDLIYVFAFEANSLSNSLEINEISLTSFSLKISSRGLGLTEDFLVIFDDLVFFF
tara:strand:- start:556 stop:747 length:192 start_codon:yes stop_codon:yes gene_type:complete